MLIFSRNLRIQLFIVILFFCCMIGGAYNRGQYMPLFFLLPRGKNDAILVIWIVILGVHKKKPWLLSCYFVGVANMGQHSVSS